MRRLTLAMFIAAQVASAPAAATNAGHYMFIVNNSPETIVGLSATAADGTVSDLAVEMPVKAGADGHVWLNAKANSNCVYTLDIEFKNGRSVHVEDYNACTNGTLRTRPAYAAAVRAAKAAEADTGIAGR